MRHFNIAGPCNPQYHYMLPATARLSESRVERLIRNQNYLSCTRRAREAKPQPF